MSVLVHQAPAQQSHTSASPEELSSARPRSHTDDVHEANHPPSDRITLAPRSQSSPTVTSNGGRASSSLNPAAPSYVRRFTWTEYGYTHGDSSEQAPFSPRLQEQGSEVDQARREKMDTALPTDDGMSELRQKLHDIRISAATTEEKALAMHELMTQNYRFRVVQAAILQGENHSRLEPTTKRDGLQHGTAEQVDDPYKVQPEDLIAVISPLASRTIDTPVIQDDERGGEIPSLLGCIHYKRNVKIQCFDCQRWFACRHCHDSASDLTFPHTLNRQKTRNMLCMLCFTPQPAAEICTSCGEYAAWYYCSKCKLWDNDSNKRIYHCDDCGICRLGEGLGKDFVHCRKCNVCISIANFASHACIEGATEGDCPLCLIRLFESKTPVVGLPCGHYMHGDCYKDLMAVTYKCPVCNKSAVNMELQWKKLDDAIQAQPMPEDDADIDGLLPPISSTVVIPANAISDVTTENDIPPAPANRTRMVWIGCNDCTRRCWTPFHWLGLKCQICDSYNTNQMAPTTVHETDAERILRQQQQEHQRQQEITGEDVLRSTGLLPPTRSVRFLDVPTSPSQYPANGSDHDRPQTPTSPRSPSGRYFVQPPPSLPRRSSFGAPRLPALPNFPSLPEGLTTRMPRMPRIPALPNLPNMPNMPNIDFPRFSPYDMISAVSRSLSPMTYYLQSNDANGGGFGSRPTSSQAQPVRPRLRERIMSNVSTRSEPALLPSTMASLKPSSPSFLAIDEDEVSFRTRIRDLLLADDGLHHSELGDDHDSHNEDDDEDFEDDEHDDSDEDDLDSVREASGGDSADEITSAFGSDVGSDAGELDRVESSDLAISGLDLKGHR